MSLINVVRIAKVIALLAFFLPWAAVSCSNVDLATASGIELIQGKMTMNPDAERQMNQSMGGMFGANAGSLDEPGGFAGTRDSGMPQQAPELGANYFGIAAAAVIVVGLLLSFVGTAKSAGRNVLVTSLIGIALCFGTVWWWKDQIQKQDGAGGGGSQFGGASGSPFVGGDSPFGGGGGIMGPGMADPFQERFGYWLALSALAVAAGAGGLAMAAGGAGAVAPKPEDSAGA